jgi:hypothetical protein
MTLLLPLPLGPTTEEKLCARETQQEVSALTHSHLSHRLHQLGLSRESARSEQLR